MICTLPESTCSGTLTAYPVNAENGCLIELGLHMPITFIPIPRIFVRFQSKATPMYTQAQPKGEYVGSQNAKRCFRVGHGIGSHVQEEPEPLTSQSSQALLALSPFGEASGSLTRDMC